MKIENYYSICRSKGEDPVEETRFCVSDDDGNVLIDTDSVDEINAFIADMGGNLIDNECHSGDCENDCEHNECECDNNTCDHDMDVLDISDLIDLDDYDIHTINIDPIDVAIGCVIGFGVIKLIGKLFRKR